VTVERNGEWQFLEVDSRGVAHTTLAATENERLAVCTRDGLVIREMQQGPTEKSRANPLVLRDPFGTKEREIPEIWTQAVAATESKVLLTNGGSRIGLLDPSSGSVVEVVNSDIDEWFTWSWCFSPDGSLAAMAGRISNPGRSTSSHGLLAQDSIATIPQYVLLLVDTETGQSKVVHGPDVNGGWGFTWSRDGAWIVFGSGYDASILKLLHTSTADVLELKFPVDVPVPLLDMTDDRSGENSVRQE
jgi:hypothetical protein